MRCGQEKAKFKWATLGPQETRKERFRWKSAWRTLALKGTWERAKVIVQGSGERIK